MNRQKTSSFGKKLKAIRENRGITKREAARLAEITETTYDSYEYQRREPTLHNLVKIAKALDVTPNELLGYQAPASENKEENKEENSGKTYWLIYTENLSDYSIGRSTTFKLAVREAEAELGRSLSKSEKPYAVQVDRELTPCIFDDYALQDLLQSAEEDGVILGYGTDYHLPKELVRTLNFILGKTLGLETVSGVVEGHAFWDKYEIEAR